MPENKFLIHNQQFRAIIGDDPTLELLVENDS